MSDIKKIAILTSGGDAPGMNAAIRAVVRTALSKGCDVYGFLDGYKGLVNNNFEEMTSSSVANCIQRGGTILRTFRFPEFTDPKVRAIAIANLQALEIDALVVLGGDGSFRGAKLLSEEMDIKTIGIPCTIDNDILGTDYSLGFDTARNTGLSAIDKIRDTAFSHSRNFLVEVMGRSSGFLALDVGIGGGAEFILLPEMNMSSESLVEKIRTRNRLKMGSIIVVAEAENPGHSFELAHEIQSKLDIEYKVAVLGHTQRGGSPTLRDRKIGSFMGYYAVEALFRGESKIMIGYNEGCYDTTAMPEADLEPRRLSDTQVLEINNILCHL